MAGLVIPLVAERRRVRQLVFLAAFLAAPGRSANEQRGSEPLDELADPVARAWGEPTRVRRVRFPLRFRVGRVA